MLRFTGDKPFHSLECAKDFLLNYDQYERYGVGRMAVIDKETTAFLGWCGIRYDAALNEYDIGFRFYKKYWNKGMATEAAKKCLEYGFNVLKLPAIKGRAVKENTASVRVLEKNGMKFKANIFFDGKAGVLYELSRNSFGNHCE